LPPNSAPIYSKEDVLPEIREKEGQKMSSMKEGAGRGNKNLGNEVGFSTRFQPGTSGNPGGRPSRTPFTDAIWGAIDLTVSELKIESTDLAPVALVKRLYSEAIGGKTPAAAELINRIEGTPRRAEPGPSGPIEIRVVYDDPAEEAAAKRKQIARLTAELGGRENGAENSDVNERGSSSSE
jgi:hypothetical protein